MTLIKKIKVTEPLSVDKFSAYVRFTGIIIFFLTLIGISAGILSPAVAQQNSLERLSVHSRSDGLGYVMRYHLREQADSFEVFQPEPDLIQLTIHGENIDTADVELPEQLDPFQEISFYDIPGGIGGDIFLQEDEFYTAGIYSDRGSNDLLLALTETEPAHLDSLTAGVEPLIWSRFSLSAESLLEGEQEDTFDYGQIKEKYRFDKVVIDPGHGGHDPGSIGHNGVKEKEIVLEIAKKLGGYIEEYLPSVEVIYTRDDDTFIELEERGSIANKAQGDLFISLHSNSHSSTQAYGTDVFFLGLERSQSAIDIMRRENLVVRSDEDNEQKELSQEDLLIYELTNSGYIASSEKVAGLIEHQFAERAQRRSRGVKQARFVVLYHASMPAVLIETGFISNPAEARYLDSDYGQTIIASAIFRAVRNYKEEYEKSQHFNVTN